MIVILKNVLRFVFHCLDSKSNSFKERRIISMISMLLNEKRASTESILLEDMMLSNIKNSQI
jgi:hypothetical protein